VYRRVWPQPVITAGNHASTLSMLAAHYRSGSDDRNATHDAYTSSLFVTSSH